MDVFNTLLPMHDAIALVALVDRYPLALRKSARGHSKATARNVDAYNRAMTRPSWNCGGLLHYSDVIMGTMASQITSLAIVYSTVYSGANQRKHQSPASLAFVRGIHRWPVNSLHKRASNAANDEVIMLKGWHPVLIRRYEQLLSNALSTL